MFPESFCGGYNGCPSAAQPAHPPFTEALKPLKHISIWMERPPRAALGGRGAALLRIVWLVLIRAL